MIQRVVAVGIILALLAGCGTSEDGDTTRVSKVPNQSSKGMRNAWLSLDGYAGPQVVGILMAQKEGYFEDLNIAMTVTTAATPDAPIRYVAEDVVDFGVIRQPQLVVAKGEGTPVIAIGSLVSRPTAAMIWLQRSGIGSIAALKGKTIGIPGLRFQERFLRTLLEKNGVTHDDVRLKRVGYDLVPALVSGQVDAIFGGAWNVEGATLEARHLEPVIITAQRLGFPDFEEQILVARRGWVSREPQLVRDVLAAVAHGTAAAIADPKAALEAIEAAGETDPDATSKTTLAGVRTTLPLLSETGYMSSSTASDLVKQMHEEGWIKRMPRSSDLLTNDYLQAVP